MESRPFCSSTNRVGLFVALLVLLLAGGCYERVADGNQTTYRFTWWIVALIAGGGVLAIPVGWKCLAQSEKLGWSLIIAGILALLAFAPTMYFDRIVIDADHVEQQSGIMGRKIHDIKFRSLRTINVVVMQDLHGVRKIELYCNPLNGQPADVFTGDLAFDAAPEILERASDCGVKIEGDSF